MYPLLQMKYMDTVAFKTVEVFLIELYLLHTGFFVLVDVVKKWISLGLYEVAVAVDHS